MRRRLPTFIYVSVLLLLAPAASAAQSPRTAIVVTSAPIFLYPDTEREPLRVAKEGTRLRVLSVQGDWVRVEFNDPRLGRRQGYIQSDLVRLFNVDLESIDLSIPSPPPDAPVTEDASREAAKLAADQSSPRSATTRIPPGYKWTGIALLAAGGLTILSGIVAGDNTCSQGFSDLDCGAFKAGWIGAGVAEAAAGAIVLGIGHKKREPMSATSLQFGPRSVRLRIRF